MRTLSTMPLGSELEILLLEQFEFGPYASFLYDTAQLVLVFNR